MWPHFARRWGKGGGSEARKFLEGKAPKQWPPSLREVGGSRPRPACPLPSCQGAAASAKACEACQFCSARRR